MKIDKSIFGRIKHNYLYLAIRIAKTPMEGNRWLVMGYKAVLTANQHGAVNVN